MDPGLACDEALARECCDALTPLTPSVTLIRRQADHMDFAEILATGRDPLPGGNRWSLDEGRWLDWRCVARRDAGSCNMG